MKAKLVPLGKPSNKPLNKTHWCGLDKQVVSDYRQGVIAVCRYQSWKEVNEDEGGPTWAEIMDGPGTVSDIFTTSVANETVVT